MEEDDGKGGKRRTNRARRERKGTPQGAPVSPLISNIYMRRFIVGWKVLGHARRFAAEIVNYADDIVVCGKAPADTIRGAVEDVMERLRLPINVTKTRSIRVPEEPLEFLGYRIGRNYRRDTGRAYIGTRPSRSSVVSVCRRISELTHRRYGLLDQEKISSPDFPGERLIVCRNPILAEQRQRKRQELLASTEKELMPIVTATQRAKEPLRGAADIGVRVGKAPGGQRPGVASNGHRLLIVIVTSITI